MEQTQTYDQAYLHLPTDYARDRLIRQVGNHTDGLVAHTHICIENRENERFALFVNEASFESGVHMPALSVNSIDPFQGRHVPDKLSSCVLDFHLHVPSLSNVTHRKLVAVVAGVCVGVL